MGDKDGQVELVVFADDWGRHPSSAQHLVRHLLPYYPTLWVNTVGTRKPRWGDLLRGFHVLANWFVPYRRDGARDWPENLRVIAPRMYPGFRSNWQRRLNARLLSKALQRALRSPACTCGASRRVAVTTLPITADLVGRIEGIDRWVYYCVDDFSVWTGTDHAVMDAMERELVAKADAVACVSEVLRERVRGMSREAELLTHGVDLAHWQRSTGANPQADHGKADWNALAEQRQRSGCRYAMFWGLRDERLDVTWCEALRRSGEVGLVVAGPRADGGGSVEPGVTTDLGVVAYDELPDWARPVDVLVMPYRDLPVTRAMQPLKLLEYLATYKPVVVRDLPATRAWADCCDVVSTAEEFVRVCLERAKTGLPPEQRAARERRLPGESWSEKARAFERILLGSR